MKHYKYLIIGGGMAGDAAVRGIRELDPGGSIALIGAEVDPPYMRPNLSKGLWKGRPMEKVWRNTQNLKAELLLSRKVSQLDSKNRSVYDDKGEEYTFEKLLIATGGSPIRLPFGGDDIIYFRDLQDYHRLRALADQKENFLIIGGGFIGSEIAAALTMAGRKVSMVFLEDAIGANIYPKELANFLNEFYRGKGVNVVPADSVASMEKKGERFTVRTKNGRTFEVDGVVGGLGIRPNIEFARNAGLKVENGIVVNNNMQTSASDIYAAGDVAMFYHAGLGRQTRVEHEDNAVRMGKLAGRNMAGAHETYTHIPMFYSDLFELGYEAVGELSSKLETVSDWQEPFKKGVVYYLENGHVRGVLLWNVWEKVDAARALMLEPGRLEAKDLIGKITG